MSKKLVLVPSALEAAWQAGSIAIREHAPEMGPIQRTAMMQVITAAVIPAYLSAIETAPTVQEKPETSHGVLADIGRLPAAGDLDLSAGLTEATDLGRSALGEQPEVKE